MTKKVQSSVRRPLDAFHEHEVLHTAYLIAHMFEEHVVEHPFAASDSKLVVEAERVSAALWDFYQSVGAVSIGSAERP